MGEGATESWPEKERDGQPPCNCAASCTTSLRTAFIGCCIHCSTMNSVEGVVLVILCMLYTYIRLLRAYARSYSRTHVREINMILAACCWLSWVMLVWEMYPVYMTAGSCDRRVGVEVR